MHVIYTVSNHMTVSTAPEPAQAPTGVAQSQAEPIFGMENFGNTCYCNSVLQCLFYIEEFREHILSLFPSNRPPHTDTPGKHAHNLHIELNKEAQMKTKETRGFTSKIFGRSREDDTNSELSSAGSQITSDWGETVHPNLEGIYAGQRAEGQNLPLVGYTDNPNATVEQRKKMAITKGPIINLDHSLASEYNRESSVLTALKDLFHCIAENSSRTGVTSPTYFIETIKKSNELFRSSMHQDAHEFYSFLLNSIFEELSSLDIDHSWFDNLFIGELTSETRCLNCETVSRRNEKYIDFSIDSEHNASVLHCLAQFSASEVLGGANKFYCDTCGGFQEAQKRMKVRSAPKILTLHLKRFKFSEDQQRNIKLLHRVLFSRYLRIPVTTDDFVEPDRLYELTSVIVHLGGGPYQGHYVAVIKTQSGWLLFDDEVVEAVDQNYVFKFFGDRSQLATAYVLFYKQTSHESHIEENLLLDSTAAQPALDSLSLTSDADRSALSDEEPQHFSGLRRGSTQSSAASPTSAPTSSGVPVPIPQVRHVSGSNSPNLSHGSSNSHSGGSGFLSRSSSKRKHGQESKILGIFRKSHSS